MAGLVRPVPGRKILPGRARSQNPQHAVQCSACIAPGTAASIEPPFLVPLHQGLKMFPLRIREISHAPDLLQFRSQSKHLLASIIYEIGSRQVSYRHRV
jgi:hypothetical protein